MNMGVIVVVLIAFYRAFVLFAASLRLQIPIAQRTEGGGVIPGNVLSFFCRYYRLFL